MRETGTFSSTNHRGIGRNARDRGQARILAALALVAPLLAGCATARPELTVPGARRPLSTPAPLDAKRAAGVEHRSVSVISGDVRFLDSSSGGVDLGPVVVFLLPRSQTSSEASDVTRRPVVISSSTPQFEPDLVAVARGQKVVLANEGPLSHGLFSADIAGRRFDLPPGTRSDPFALPPQGPLRFYCSLHSDETFVVFGGHVDHIAVVRGTEPFRFEPVEPGRYTLTIWSDLVSGPVRDVYADGYTRAIEPVWIDPDIVRRFVVPEDRR